MSAVRRDRQVRADGRAVRARTLTPRDRTVPWICGRVFRTGTRPSGRGDSPWTTPRRCPPPAPTRVPLAHQLHRTHNKFSMKRKKTKTGQPLCYKTGQFYLLLTRRSRISSPARSAVYDLRTPRVNVYTVSTPIHTWPSPHMSCDHHLLGSSSLATENRIHASEQDRWDYEDTQCYPPAICLRCWLQITRILRIRATSGEGVRRTINNVANASDLKKTDNPQESCRPSGVPNVILLPASVQILPLLATTGIPKCGLTQI